MWFPNELEALVGEARARIQGQQEGLQVHEMYDENTVPTMYSHDDVQYCTDLQLFLQRVWRSAIQNILYDYADTVINNAIADAQADRAPLIDMLTVCRSFKTGSIETEVWYGFNQGRV